MAFTFRQKVGDSDIVASGAAVLTGIGNFECNLSDGVETLEIEFSFDNDETDKTERYVLEGVTPDKGVLHLINFRRHISGFSEPFFIGTLNNRPLSLSIVVYSIGGEKVLNYTFLLGRAA